MIHIFTSVVNRPDFVLIQDKLFKKYLKNPYTFHVVDDSVDPSITKQFETICKENDIVYYRKTERTVNLTPAEACAHTIQWTYDTIIKTTYSDSVVLFCDSDMFLIDEFDILEYTQDCIIGGLPQIRGNVEYIWNGIMFFNMPKIRKIDLDIDFSDGMVEGQLTDVGGHTYYYFKRNKINFKRTDVIYPTHFYDIELLNDLVTKGYNFELHLDGKFLHYRAATNWHSNWKGTDDPLVAKTKIFNKVMEEILK